MTSVDKDQNIISNNLMPTQNKPMKDSLIQHKDKLVNFLDLEHLKILIATQQAEEAKALLREYLVSNESNVMSLFQAADLFMEFQLLDIAEEVYSEILQKESNNISALGRLGDLAQKRGDNNSAIDYFTKIIEHEPQPDSWVYIGLGNALENIGDLQSALSYFEKAFESSDNKSVLSLRIQNLIIKLEQDSGIAKRTPIDKSNIEMPKFDADQPDSKADEEPILQMGLAAQKKHRPHKDLAGSFVGGLDYSDSALERISVFGKVERLNGLYLEGWVCNRDFPEGIIVVELVSDDQVLGDAVADVQRTDFSKNKDDLKYYGFKLRVPDEFMNGSEATLNVREKTTGSILKGGYVIAESDLQLDYSEPTTNETSIVWSIYDIVAPHQKHTVDIFIDGKWIGLANVGDNFEADKGLIYSFNIPTIYLDGGDYEITLLLSKHNRILGSFEIKTPLLTSTAEILRLAAIAGFKREELPNMVGKLIKRIASSQLFDLDYYSEQVGKFFKSKEDAIVNYLLMPSNWQYKTSVWLDVDFICKISSNVKQKSISPLEWYMKSGQAEDIGPNPLFSNEDFLVLSKIEYDEEWQGISLFDEWLGMLGRGTYIDPSILVDLSYIRDVTLAGKATLVADVLDFFIQWLESKPKQRKIEDLSWYFDKDWLNQKSIINKLPSSDCLFTAFRLGELSGIAPSPILQQDEHPQNYYQLIKAYELLWLTNQIDDISAISEFLDTSLFNSAVSGFVAIEKSFVSGNQSNLKKYLSANRNYQWPCFITSIDEEFIDIEYDGLIDFCSKHSKIADINWIWSRWLRILGLPGKYLKTIGGAANSLSIQSIGTLRTYRFNPTGKIHASLVIPTYARDDLVLQCVLSIIKSSGSVNIEIVVAEDASHVDCAWILEYFMPFAKIIKNPINLGFLLNCNQAVQQTSSDFVVLVNNDVIVKKNALNEMLQTFSERPQAAVVGGLILNADGTIQENGGILWKDASAWNFHRNWMFEDDNMRNVREADYVSGCWIGIRRSIWDEIGGFDTRYVPAYCEEADFCLSCWQRGHKVYINPHSVVTHLDGATMGQDENSNTLKAYQKINKVKLYEKWKHLLKNSFNENGRPSPFLTGRIDKKRYITLVFDHYVPEYDRDAGSRTMFAICKTLAAMENNYVVFIPANNHRSKYTFALEKLGIEVVTGGQGWNRFDQMLSGQKTYIKHFIMSRIEVANKFKWHVDQLPGCKKSIYIHDIDALRGFPFDPDSPGHEELVNEAMDNYFKKNSSTFELYNNILSCSEDESKLLRKYYGGKIVDIFPYDFQSKKFETVSSNPSDIIFIGSYNHPPNSEAIEYFLDNDWEKLSSSLPEAKLHLVGAGFEDATFIKGKNIILHGQVTDQTLDYLYSICRVSIAPLISGAGVKGKVIESCSKGIPCVGTEVAYQGMTLPSQYDYLRGSLDSFAERLLKAYGAFNQQIAKDMVAFYSDCEKHHSIRDVIPRLVASTKGGI
jgi:GT2 family glycosyltransferase/tetratricopeptide (TPR) repeat protein